MLDILQGTPLWVYGVFLVLTYYGVRACFESRVSKRSLQITPMVFVALSLASLELSRGLALPLSAYVLGLLAGGLLALRFCSFTNVKLVEQSLVMGGTVQVLIVYWCFFAWRYYLGYRAAINPELAKELAAVVQASLGAGLINGLIVGRSLKLLRLFKAQASDTAAQ